MNKITSKDIPMTGKELRADGMKRAENNANFRHEKWSDKAYQFLQIYIQDHEHFMTEDIRFASTNNV